MRQSDSSHPAASVVRCSIFHSRYGPACWSVGRRASSGAKLNFGVRRGGDTMRIPPQRVCLLGFATTLALGIGWIVIGLLVIPALPWFQLDRVLTREELADPRKREATLELLQCAAGNMWLFWSVAGVLLVIVSAAGLASAFRLDR